MFWLKFNKKEHRKLSKLALEDSRMYRRNGNITMSYIMYAYYFKHKKRGK